MKKRVLAYFVFLAALGTASFLAISNRQEIRDWWYLRSYVPSAEISSLAERSSMSEKGTDLFYVHDPQILDSAGFNESCPNRETSIVLGCYDGINIYVFDVVEEKLEGIKEVTASHEMLHAAYDRLDEDTAEEVNEWLLVAREQISSQRVLDAIKSYEDLGESVVLNELHSIVGTEVAEIPEFLETYYSQYFADRQVVVGLSQSYEAVFEDLQNQVAEFDKRLSELSSQIALQEASLEVKVAQIDSERKRLEELLASNQVSEYNAGVSSFNALINSYNAELNSLKGDITRYNELVAERNEITVEQNNLVQSIDSRFEEESN